MQKKNSDKLINFLDIQEKLINVLTNKLTEVTPHYTFRFSFQNKQKLMEMVNLEFLFKIIKYPAE